MSGSLSTLVRIPPLLTRNLDSVPPYPTVNELPREIQDRVAPRNPASAGFFRVRWSSRQAPAHPFKGAENF